MNDAFKIIAVVAGLALLFFGLGRFAKKKSDPNNEPGERLAAEEGEFSRNKFLTSKAGDYGKKKSNEFYYTIAARLKNALSGLDDEVSFLSELKPLTTKNEFFFVNSEFKNYTGKDIIFYVRQNFSADEVEMFNSIIKKLK